MYWLDIGIILIIAVSVLIATIRGFMREVVALATWIGAFVVSLTFANHLAPLLPDFVQPDLVRQGVAWFILFVATMVVGSLVNFLLNSMVEKSGLSAANRSLGALFGVLRGVLIVVALILLGSMIELPKTDWWQSAKLLPYFQNGTVWVLELLPSDFSAQFQLPETATPSIESAIQPHLKPIINQ